MSGRERSLVEVQPGVAVERDVYDIAQRVQEYDPNLRIQYCNPDRADITDAPYRLVEIGRDGQEYVVFYIWNLDASVLERIYSADMAKHQILELVEENNKKARAELNRRYKDRLGEAHDMLSHAMKHETKSSYSLKDGNRKVTIYDDRPTKVEEL